MTPQATSVAPPPISAADMAMLQLLIANQLAEGHGRHWSGLDLQAQAEYLADADALITQGLGAYWQDPGEPPPVLTPQMEAEVFAFDEAVHWFLNYLTNRYRADEQPSDLADPTDWDTWLTVLVTTSEPVRRAWNSKNAADLNVTLSIPHSRDGTISRGHFAAAVAAVLAHRHQTRWTELTPAHRAAYLRDAELLVSAGLTAWTGQPT